MTQLRVLFYVLLISILAYSCSKDESTFQDGINTNIVRNQQNQINAHEQHSSSNSEDGDLDRLCSDVDLSLLSENDFFINDPSKISEIENAVIIKGANYPISLLANDIGTPIYTRIASSQTEDQTGTVFWIPFEKPKESLITAVLPIVERNNTLTVGKIIPRMSIIQLDKNDITEEIIQEAILFNTLDMEIFETSEVLLNEISKMEITSKEDSDTRQCGWLYIQVTMNVLITNTGVDVNSTCWDGGTIKYHNTKREKRVKLFVVWWCDSWGEAPTNPNDWTYPPNTTGGNGNFDSDGYISELDFQHAQEKHYFLKQYSPFYSYLDEKFDECENGSYGAVIGAEIISNVLELQDEDLNGLSVDEVKEELKSVYNPQTLFGYVQNAIEHLADLGIELSFTQTILAINSVSGEYSQLYDSLCSLENIDREILLDDFDNEVLVNSTEEERIAYINFIKNYPDLVTDPSDKLKLLSDPVFTSQLLVFLDANTSNPNYQYGQLASQIGLLSLSYVGTLSNEQIFLNAQNLHNNIALLYSTNEGQLSMLEILDIVDFECFDSTNSNCVLETLIEYLSDAENPRPKLCSEHVEAELLTDEEVEAWYFKMLNFRYNFAYVDPSNPSFKKLFYVGFGDFCVNAYSGVVVNKSLAEIAFTEAFELSITQTVDFLNISPWDDIQMNFGGGITIEAYINTIFRSYLELNLSVIFFGSPNTSTSPCDGVEGFLPVYNSGC